MKIKLSLLILFLFLLPSCAWASLSIEPGVQPDEDSWYNITGSGAYTLTTNGAVTDCPIYLDSLVYEDHKNHLIVTLQDFKTSTYFSVRGNVTLILKGDNVLGVGLSYESDEYERAPEAFISALTIDGDGSLTAIGQQAPDNPDDEPSFYASAGIELNGAWRPELVIRGGTIHATGGYGHAGIGGDDAHITIHDGSITAVGGYGSAGIGGNKNEDWTDDTDANIFIHGGSVTAEGGYGGAGIGNSAFIPQTKYFETSASISITGGSIHAKGGTGGAGIGGSGEVYISVTGGEITSAQGGAGDGTFGDGAGIGGNHNSSAAVYISGGTVSSSSCGSGAGIGGGEGGDGRITILDGSITVQSEYGPGIGGNTALIAINGGTIHTSSSATAIGCSLYEETATGSVTISGGTITAVSQTDCAIGSDLVIVNGGHITARGYPGIRGDTIINDGVIYAHSKTSGGPGIGSRRHDITINGGVIFSEGKSGFEGNYILITGGQIGSKEFVGDGYYGTGINGQYITITGGDICATGSVDLAGIGASWEGHSDILITGGSITAYGYDGTAGIGNGRSSSDIVINGGVITAYGGSGIEGNTVTINDGVITAHGVGNYYGYSAGILGDQLHINGGVIEATCSGIGSGIGSDSIFRHDRGFDDGYDTEIVITGGDIKAAGGNYSAGIGCSYDFGHAGSVRISGGNIQATGGLYAAGIGGGAGSNCDVTISGGTIHAVGGEAAPAVGPGSGGNLEGISSYGYDPLEPGSGPVTISTAESAPLDVQIRERADSEWIPFDNPSSVDAPADISDAIRPYGELKLAPASK